ncbi:hypothetical protein E1B28_011432 [Marasmius oreades]|uniref:GATA-type domain-containing protein n=1 Tax=Marasmius oreades TaxID=181124 RepID=A0A9P7UQ77_9AGAR|nr:uncharacterized protein E1B28_011432 [Marasmius oreades]KAG7089780.1 hypothetical protein E1B28_011432 [Marasmius oreades]
MTEQESGQLPEVGHQRCYWALLSDRLEFIYFDPVLQYHLQAQAGILYGRSLLSFVHPDERETAEYDLGGVLREHSLHGSITRVRFFRLSKVRQQLGFSGPSVPLFPSAERVVLDGQFMAVDITINWVAEGLVLCFIHASVDIDPVADNNHAVKSPWTNWCGTPVMPTEQIALLFERLLCAVPEISPGRKFQILSNKPGRPLFMSWPPGAPEENANCRALVDKIDFGQGPSGESSPYCSNPEAKTNCTRRFLSRGEVEAGIESESVFIPHGCVIFACHKLSPFPSSAPSSASDRKASSGSSLSTHTTSTPAIPLASMGYNNSSASSYPLPSHQSSQSTFYDHHHYSLPPLQSTTLPSSPTSYSYQPSQHHHGSLTAPYSHYSGSSWNTQPTHPSIQSLRSSSYWSHGSGYENGQGGPPQLSLNGGPPQPHDNYKPLSPAGYSSYSPTTPSSAGTGINEDHPSPTSASSNSVDVVPPPRRRVSPTSREFGGNGSSKEGKSHGNRPAGVPRCSSCKATTSPEWRKGPSGKKELCNACGLRYARSRAKKEGHVPSSARRRKDKILKPRDSTTPPVSLSAPPGSTMSTYSHSSVGPYQPSSTPPYGSGGSLRRAYPHNNSYDDGFSSGSGSDIYAHRSSLGTPSPSPPAGGATGSFVAYQSGHHSDHNVHGTAARAYYASSIPSPLAAVPPTTMSSQSFDNERDDSVVVKRETLPTPVSVERQYYGTSAAREPRNADYSRYDVVEGRDGRDYNRDFERENKGRGLVTG